MTRHNLHDVMIDSLADVLGADRQILDAWPLLGQAVSAPSLKRFCTEGSEYTGERIRRLEKAFAILKITPIAKPSDGMAALIKDALDVAGKGNVGPVRDAAILAQIQKLTHYGHASYVGIVGFAETLGEDGVAKLLSESLDEKADAIEEMIDMADGEINARATRADA